MFNVKLLTFSNSPPTPEKTIKSLSVYVYVYVYVLYKKQDIMSYNDNYI